MNAVTKAIGMIVVAIAIGATVSLKKSDANPDKYPQFAQHELPKGLAPEFVYLSQVTDEIRSGRKPFIIDVRTKEEYQESHIAGSASIPLSDMPNRLADIPKTGLLVLY